MGKCLDDSPTEIEYPYPDLPPGAMYNAELQCRLQFNVTDEDITVCSAPHEICSQLWCQVNGECVTNMRPTAPGTKCGKHKVYNIFDMAIYIKQYNYTDWACVRI